MNHCAPVRRQSGSACSIADGGKGISNIMTFNGHLLLLVVATGLFVRLWSTNDRLRSPAVWRTHSRAASTMPPPQPIAADREILVRAVSTSSSRESPREEVWTAATCPIPLPAGMDAGEFRVIDDTGRVARLVLTARGPAAGAGEQPGFADLQTMIVDARRWYFIRLHAPVARNTLDRERESSASVQPEVADADPIRTACANRKFDFTGFDVSVNSHALQTAEDFRPEPPALPVTE